MGIEMSSDNCFNCGNTQQNVPLLILTFVNKDLRVCPQCLPTLIHKPQELQNKLQQIYDENKNK